MKITSAAFLGGADFKPSNQTYKDAYKTAFWLSAHGLTVINGGGPGVMRASTEGAHEAKGKVIGVTYYPPYKHKYYEGRDPTNEFDEEIKTRNYFNRTKRMLEMADLHIVFKGGTGTISEFGMSWASSRIHYTHRKPIILFGEFWEEIIEAFQKYMYMREDEQTLYYIINTPKQVLQKVKDLQKSA